MSKNKAAMKRQNSLFERNFLFTPSNKHTTNTTSFKNLTPLPIGENEFFADGLHVFSRNKGNDPNFWARLTLW